MKNKKSTNRNSKIETRKSKMLVWVYPPNNWKSSSHKTFVYGSSDPHARLFVSTDEYLTPERIKIFPNGNFAKVINLPNVKNNVQLIQILGKKKTILKRKIFVGASLSLRAPTLRSGQAPRSNPDRLSVNRSGLLRPQPFLKKELGPRNDSVIVIDPGHGGKEHGTHSPKGVPEKHFNLQIAKLLVGAYCNTPLRGKIYLTRTKDKFVSLKNRVNFAKKKKCNLFISIHHNALPDGEDPLKYRGVGIYYTHDFVKPLARKLLESISRSVGACHGVPLLRKHGIFKRNFFVTRPDFYKGVLIECGFLTHPIEAEYMTQRDVQEKIVRGIVKGLRF